MDLDKLAQQAKELKFLSYDSPRVSLWERRAKAFVKGNYGEEYLRILEDALSWGQVIRPGEGPTLHAKAMDKAVVLLDSLKEEPLLGNGHETVGEDKGGFPIERLHPLIYGKCKSLFENEDYSEAVEKGFKIVRDRLRKLTGYEKGAEAFGKGKIHIRGAAALHVDKDFNEGVKFLTMAIDMFRNEKSHTSDGNINEPSRAHEYLVLCSLVMKLLEDAEIAS